MNLGTGTDDVTMSTIRHSMNSSLMDDGLSDPPSSPESNFDESELLHQAVTDDVTAQLAAAGPIGVAAAAAIASGRKRRRPHVFETNPSIRRRQQTRLLRKLKNTIEEYSTRVGQQAIVLFCTPGKPTQASSAFKVFGSQPLEDVIRNCRSMVMQELEAALAQQAPPAAAENPALHELPPLNIDGIPTPVDKMTQAQLRAFIPEMLKYSTGRSKPGWGKPEVRPIWWPNDVPWANVRSDVRTEDEKKRVTWTHALRTIVKNCYLHHGREDLLPSFHDDNPLGVTVQSTPSAFSGHTMVQTINNPDGTVSIIQIDTGDASNPQIVTLADGTQAQIVHSDTSGVTYITPSSLHDSGLAAVADSIAANAISGLQGIGVELNPERADSPPGVATLSEATLGQDGQIILAGDNGLGTPDGMVTIPVSMYQTVVTSIAQLTNSGSHVLMAKKEHNAPTDDESDLDDGRVDSLHISDTEELNGDVTVAHAVEVMTVSQR